MLLLCYLFLGCITGLFSGLFGIGGGIIIMPILSLVFRFLNFPEEIIMHITIGTSLSIILVTVSNSAYHHYKSGNVDFLIFNNLVFFVIVGSLFGGQFSAGVSTLHLRYFFTIYVILVALKMGLKSSEVLKAKNTHLGMYSVVGFIIGFKSAILGIGGGTISIPFLNWRGVEMKKAVGISAALGVPISFFGSLSYLYQGYGHQSLPEHSFGFVYIPAFLGVILTSGYFSKVGANLSNKISQDKLQKGFALFLSIVALKSIYEILFN